MSWTSGLRQPKGRKKRTEDIPVSRAQRHSRFLENRKRRPLVSVTVHHQKWLARKRALAKESESKETRQVNHMRSPSQRTVFAHPTAMSPHRRLQQTTERQRKAAQAYRQWVLEKRERENKEKRRSGMIKEVAATEKHVRQLKARRAFAAWVRTKNQEVAQRQRTRRWLQEARQGVQVASDTADTRPSLEKSRIAGCALCSSLSVDVVRGGSFTLLSQQRQQQITSLVDSKPSVLGSADEDIAPGDHLCASYNLHNLQRLYLREQGSTDAESESKTEPGANCVGNFPVLPSSMLTHDLCKCAGPSVWHRLPPQEQQRLLRRLQWGVTLRNHECKWSGWSAPTQKKIEEADSASSKSTSTALVPQDNDLQVFALREHKQGGMTTAPHKVSEDQASLMQFCKDLLSANNPRVIDVKGGRRGVPFVDPSQFLPLYDLDSVFQHGHDRVRTEASVLEELERKQAQHGACDSDGIHRDGKKCKHCGYRHGHIHEPSSHTDKVVLPTDPETTGQWQKVSVQSLVLQELRRTRFEEESLLSL